MDGLLPKEVLVEILESTGAYGESKISHVVRGDFPSFAFEVKQRTDFDLGLFDNSLDEFSKDLAADWGGHYFPDCIIERDPSRLIDLTGYAFRKESLCSQFRCQHVQNSFLFYVASDFVYHVLNVYLGGNVAKKAAPKGTFTNLEKSFFKEMVSPVGRLLAKGLSLLIDTNMDLVTPLLDETGQKKEFDSKFVVSEFLVKQGDKGFRMACAIPLAFVKLLTEGSEGADGALTKKRDPLWQKVVREAFLTSPVELVVRLGNCSVPFGQSLSLKVGDVLPWEKSGTEVGLYHNDDLRVSGTLGVVDERFAIRVEKVF